MNDKKIIKCKKEALQFSKNDCAYIHLEAENHLTQLVVSGDNITLLHSILVILNRIGEVNNKDTAWAVEALNEYIETLNTVVTENGQPN